MGLIINSFYSNKDIFLRELISNASDALDKLRYKSITEPEEAGLDIQPHSSKLIFKTNKTLILIDTGIGMTKEELITNLETIAKSGTKGFMEALRMCRYLHYLSVVAGGFSLPSLHRVTVISKSLHDDQYIWESTAGGSFMC